MADYMKELGKPPATPGTESEEFLVPSNAKLIRQMRTAAAWLWAYAAFTVANLVLLQIAAPIRIVVGWITAEVVVLVARAAHLPMAIGYAIAAVLIAITAAVAIFIQRFAIWSFWAGMALLAVDAVVTYLFTDLGGLWPFLIHGVAIWFLFLGLKAAKLYRGRRAAGKA